MLKNKIIVMDLDGTLLKQSKEISAENIKFIKEISKNNLIIIASGRNYKDVLKVIEKANLKQSIYKNIICSNGQLIYNIQNNELVKKNFISHFIAEKIIDDLEKFIIYWYIIINNKLFCKEIKYNCEKYIENKRYKIIIIRNFKDIPQLENSTAMLNLDNHIKNIYNKYFTQNPKEFLDVYEIILEKGINLVQNAIEELEKVSPIDISSEKIKLICNKQIIEENIDIENDEIAIASAKLLTQYKSLVPNSNVQFVKQEVMI